jgi:hypothetical protein
VTTAFEQRSTGKPGEWKEHIGDAPIGGPPAQLSPRDYALLEIQRAPLHVALTLLEFAANFTCAELEELCEDYDVGGSDREAILRHA